MDLIVYRYKARSECAGGHHVITAQKQNGGSNSSSSLKKSEGEMPNVGNVGKERNVCACAEWKEQGRGILLEGNIQTIQNCEHLKRLALTWGKGFCFFLLLLCHCSKLNSNKIVNYSAS